VQVFNFEAALSMDDGEKLDFRGDGIYLARTRQLRLNRESELAGLIRERFAPAPPPYGGKAKIIHFDASPIVADLTELLRTRISAPPVVAQRKERSASATPAMGSVAYMLRWEH
jgi:hypothetical protein